MWALPLLAASIAAASWSSTLQAQPALGSSATAATSRSDSVRIDTPTGTIFGTRLVVGSPAPSPVVLIIAGSGPTDRDGNSLALTAPNNSLKMLAEGLAARGISSVRFDKRGIAASRAAGSAEKDLRFDNYVSDAADWIRFLRNDKRFSTVTVVGHSEGSLIGMMAAERAGADGFVSIAGPGRPAGLVIREQLAAQLPTPELLQSANHVFDELESGRMVDSFPPMLASLFRPSVQPYLISWLRYNPTTEIGRLAVPVLIVQGSTDIQVTIGDAEALSRAQPKARLLVIDGMNHIMKMVPPDRATQIKSYSDPSLPVAPELMDAVNALVRSTRPR